MIIQLYKILLLLLCVISFTLFAVSCVNNGEINDNENDIISDGSEKPNEGGDNADKAELIDIISGGVCKYEILYPADCDGYISSAITVFISDFKKATGITLSASAYESGADAPSGKIIFGKIDTADIIGVYKELKYYDYSVSVCNDNIVIAAYNYNGYVRAIDYINKNVLSRTEKNDGGTELNMIVNEYKNSTKKSYSIDEWDILDKELKEYRIVYASDEIFDQVKTLRNKIADACGAYLDIVKDTESEPCENEILIGDTNRQESDICDTPLPMHFYAKVYGEKLVIKSGGVYSGTRYLDPLFTALTDGQNSIFMGEDYVCEGDLFDDPLDSSYAEGMDLRIMSCNILAELETWSLVPEHYPYLPVSVREELVYAALDYYQPTIVGFQELTANWYTAIEENYHAFDKWELLKFDNPNRADDEYVFSTVMYRKDLYTLLDSGMSFYSKHSNGRSQCYTWAVLKEIESGREFCFVSTHWQGTGKEHGFLQSQELSTFVNSMRTRCPVFTTGDFNSNEISPEFIEYLDSCDMVDAKHAAKEQLNNVGSWHNFLKDDLSWGSCDHITATSDTTVLKFETLYKNGLIYASDHCWLIADVKFN